jgi:putative NADH-flavin reductase
VRLVVLGATGPTGRLIVSQGLEQGHHVTALARHPEAMNGTHSHLRVLGFDVLDPDAELGTMIGDADAVLSALGSRGHRPTTVYSAGAQEIAKAMEHVGVRRFLCISSDGIDVAPGLPWAQRVVMSQIIQRLYRHEYADMVRMEGFLASSALDWTVVRAPRLIDGAPTGRIRVSLGEPILDGGSLRRADLAQFMIAAVTQPETFGCLVHLASQRKGAS